MTGNRWEFVPGDEIVIAPGRTVKRIRGTVAEFLIASAAKHDARVKREYELLIEVARSRIEAALSEESA